MSLNIEQIQALNRTTRRALADLLELEVASHPVREYVQPPAPEAMRDLRAVVDKIAQAVLPSFRPLAKRLPTPIGKLRVDPETARLRAAEAL